MTPANGKGVNLAGGHSQFPWCYEEDPNFCLQHGVGRGLSARTLVVSPAIDFFYSVLQVVLTTLLFV